MLGEGVGRQMLEIRWRRNDGEVVGPEPAGPVPAAVAMAGDFLDGGACDIECYSVGVGTAIARCFNRRGAHLDRSCGYGAPERVEVESCKALFAVRSRIWQRGSSGRRIKG